MKITKALSAVAASAMLLGLAIPASASSLMNVVSSGTTTISGKIDSTSTSWDKYAGAQVTLSTTVSAASALDGSSASQNFGGEANITFFKGGDYSTTSIKGMINQSQTTLSTGIQTSFGN